MATSKQFGKYRLIAHLATGGMADIYLASQTSLAGFEKLIVIKRILANLSREQRFVEMFLDEARIAAMLNHPNVVQIFDLGRIDGQYFIAMEYLPGESMSMIIKTCRRHRQPFPPYLAASMVMQAAEGLHHAHSMTGKDGKPLGIVHRDVSPQNIFVLYDGAVKVVDFGIAKAASRSTHTRTGTLKGKYAYMSPEQVLGGELDGRSDVYSLGIVLWECLTGRKLYRQENDLELLQAITQQDVPSPRTVRPEIPAAIEAVTLKALARKVEDRFDSAAAFRAALSGYLKGVQADWDTVAIGRFVQSLFTERIEEKRRLIESAQAAEIDLGDQLFGDLSQYASDTEISVPRSTPGSLVSLAGQAAQRRRRKWPALVAFVLILVAGGGLAAYYFLLLPHDGTGGPDAGPAATAIADTGPAAPADAGNATSAAADTGPPDAGSAVAAADPEQDDQPGLRRKRRRNRRKTKWRKRRVADARDPRSGQDKDEKKDEGNKNPVPKTDQPQVHGPPGKLRLVTNPWSNVYYKGKKLGQTPLVDVELPSGLVKLRAVNEEAGIDKLIIVKIKPGQRNVHRQNLF